MAHPPCFRQRELELGWGIAVHHSCRYRHDDTGLELVLNMAHSSLVVYDLPGTANARILWGAIAGAIITAQALIQPKYKP